MGSMAIGVCDIFHDMSPFLPVHHQTVQGVDIFVAPVQYVVSPSFFQFSSVVDSTLKPLYETKRRSNRLEST